MTRYAPGLSGGGRAVIPLSHHVIPAKAGTHGSAGRGAAQWIPASAGMTIRGAIGTGSALCRVVLLAPAQYLGHLRQDRHRDLGRRDRADRQPDRAVDAGEVGSGETHFLQAVAPPPMRALRAERADIEALRTQSH